MSFSIHLFLLSCIKNGVRAPSRNWYRVGPKLGDPQTVREQPIAAADAKALLHSSLPNDLCEECP